MPKVSVGVSFHNSERTLKNCIRSVIAQTFQDWELILVDDGSFDSSFEIASSVKDSRIKAINGGMNKGLAYRLNQITQLARGEYIARMDADDLMHPYRLQRQLEYLDKNPDCEVLGTRVYYIDSMYNPVGLSKNIDLTQPFGKVLASGLMMHPTITGRIDWFKNNPYDASLKRAQDRELWCRTYGNHKFGYLDEPLHFYMMDIVTSWPNYRQAQATERLIFRRYMKKVGIFKAYELIVGTYLKEVAYALLVLFGRGDILLNRRIDVIGEAEKEKSAVVIKAILETN